MKQRLTGSPISNAHRLAALGAALALALILPPLADAQPYYDYQCSSVTPPAAAGPFYRYKECDIDFDGGGWDRTAMFFENRGSESDPPHEVEDDRHCYQAKTFEDGTEPDAADFEYIRFSLMLPESQTSDFPLLVVLRGGGVGWSNVGPVTYNSWRLDTDGDPLEWDKGLYKGRLDLAHGGVDENVMLGFVIDADDNVVDRLRQAYPGWAILVPSGCSHDQWNGRPGLVNQDEAFENAAHTRYGYAALVETLDWIDSAYGIEYLYVVGGSGGGTGAFLLAADLADDLTIELRGVVAEAAALETEAREDLFDPSDERDVDADDNCADTEATVPCAAPAEPFATANVEVGLERSISEEIDPFSGTGITVPVLHMFNSRDFDICFDICESDQKLHGAIEGAIEARKDGGFDEDFDVSESVRMCVGECQDEEGVVLECTDHTVLGWRDGEPVGQAVDCVEEWIEEVEAYFDSGDPYARPTECDDIRANTGAQDPPVCGEQAESLY